MGFFKSHVRRDRGVDGCLSMTAKTTHFGYQDVAVDEKADKVADVFHSVADNYDIMNDLMSFGVHRLWKWLTIQIAGARAGHKVLDLAGGTGDLTKQFARQVGRTGQVVLADINNSMLQVGRDRLLDAGHFENIDITQVNAECLPFPDNYFDRISIAFGLRNVTHKDRALSEMYRVIKPGGQVLILEFSKPVLPGLDKLYDTYSFQILPKIGKWVADDEASYRYLAESIRMHPDQDTLRDMMITAGFCEPDYLNFTGGIVAVHRGYKY